MLIDQISYRDEPHSKCIHYSIPFFALNIGDLDFIGTSGLWQIESYSSSYRPIVPTDPFSVYGSGDFNFLEIRGNSGKMTLYNQNGTEWDIAQGIEGVLPYTIGLNDAIFRAAEVDDGHTFPGAGLTIGYFQVDGNFRLIASPVPEPVPEPTTVLLLGAGLIGLAGYGRNKFRK